MKTYTIEDIKTYLNSQNSLGDIYYNLDNIDIILEREYKKLEEDGEEHELDPIDEW